MLRDSDCCHKNRVWADHLHFAGPGCPGRTSCFSVFADRCPDDGLSQSPGSRSGHALPDRRGGEGRPGKNRG